ncbi:hypothetical protein [Streptomyces sp. NPDC001914]|uniref:hypothetical protein n=1 Tax=Streptomyces sp. NPDC001914 TaxID=3364623 RepID=UPI0036CFDC54
MSEEKVNVNERVKMTGIRKCKESNEFIEMSTIGQWGVLVPLLHMFGCICSDSLSSRRSGADGVVDDPSASQLHEAECSAKPAVPWQPIASIV